MSAAQDELLANLRAQFLSDPDDQIDQIELLALRLVENQTSALQEIMRVCHNLKGAAQLSGLSDFAGFVHESESVFQALSLRKLEGEDLSLCASLARRIGTLLRKKFESIRDGSTVEARELSAWELTMAALHQIANTAPLASDSSSASSSGDVVTSAPVKDSRSMDDWGLGSAAEAESSGRSAAATSSAQGVPTMSPSPMAMGAIQAEPIKSSSEAAQGWGIFEDTPDTKIGGGEGSQITSDIQQKHVSATASAPFKPAGQQGASAHDSRAVKGLSPTPAQPKMASSATTLDGASSYLLCHHGPSTYAVATKLVQEILPDRKLKALPIVRKNVAGVISFRGQIMPVIDIFKGNLSSAFTNSDPAAEKVSVAETAGCIVVCQLERKLFGVRVDRVSTVIDIKDNQLQMVQTKLSSEETRLISHLAIVNDQTISFIDLGGVLPK